MDKTRQYERVFGHFDDNKDGKISPIELRQCLSSINNCDQISLAEAEAVVLLMDSDGDGLLNMSDFIRLLEGTDEEEKVKDLREAFRMYEEQGSGGITAKSLKRMLSKLGEKKSVYECKCMIAMYDVNGDGVLSFNEFSTMMG